MWGHTGQPVCGRDRCWAFLFQAKRWERGLDNEDREIPWEAERTEGLNPATLRNVQGRPKRDVETEIASEGDIPEEQLHETLEEDVKSRHNKAPVGPANPNNRESEQSTEAFTRHQGSRAFLFQVCDRA